MNSTKVLFKDKSSNNFTNLHILYIFVNDNLKPNFSQIILNGTHSTPHYSTDFTD